MKFASNKKTDITIAIFLLLTISITVVALPIASAHTPPWTVPTWCYASVTNSVIGVNQQEIIVFWANVVPPTAQGAYGDRWTFWVDITKPDGSKETLGPLTSDPVGSGWASYTPTQVGTYTVIVRMDEHKITGLPDLTPSVISNPAYINDTYLGSTSDPVEFIAQEEPIQPWPEAPLPTQFWTRPINEANRNWARLAANWLAGAAQNVGPTVLFGYGTAPESAHIMWATPMWAGGIMDARFGDIGYQTSHYEGLGFSPPIILNGKIYYNVLSLPREGWRVLDLYTGEELWFHNTTGPATGQSASSSGSIPYESLAFGQILNFECPNQHGGFPYLWSTSGPGGTWMMFDAYTGNYICSIANTTQTERRGTRTITTGATGTAVYGKDGSILRYNIVNLGTTTPEYYLQVWNTTRAIWWKPSWASNQYWMWRPGLNVTYDGRNGFSLNASIPDIGSATIRAVREDKYIIVGTPGKNNGTYVLQGWLAAFNLKPDANGYINPTMLWNITFTPPPSVPDVAAGSGLASYGVAMSFVDPEDGVFLFWDRLLRKWYGYSLETGQQLWTGEPEIPWSFYNMGVSGCVYQGMLLSFGDGCAAGELRAYDIKTGKILWKYVPEQVGFESPYGNYPISITCIADGKIYLVSGEHSPTQPLWRGSYLRCVNASNGVELWKILHWGSLTSIFPGQGMVVVADGFLVGLNFYDNQIYCYGKGPSATTVSAPLNVIKRGESVMITGMVTDRSYGAKKAAERLGYPNGLPAVSDEDQQAWMEFVYAQQAMPQNAKGVEVSLDTLDPNGNFFHIGTVTTDSSGMFKKMFTPEVPGEYTIIASFAGSKSYYGSFAETAVGVVEAPPESPPPEYPQPIDPTWTIVGVGIVLLIAIVLVGIWIKKK